MTSESSINRSAGRAVVTIGLIVGLLALTFVSASADTPCIECRANAAYGARLSALAEQQAAAASVANAAYAARLGALAERGVAVATPVIRTSFDFLDHELMSAGGYALRPAVPVARGADFDFLDHELMFAGGYALRPAAAPEMAAE